MKRVTTIWIILVLLAGFGGYVAGSSHNKPRVLIARQLVHMLLKQKVGSTPTADNWAVVKKTFEDNEEDYNFTGREEWNLWGGPALVNVVYNIRNDEVIITCKKRSTDGKKCIP